MASFKNLRSPNSNSPQTPKEEVKPFPHHDDALVNGGEINESESLTGPEIKWGPPQAAPAHQSGENRPPMKLNK